MLQISKNFLSMKVTLNNKLKVKINCTLIMISHKYTQFFLVVDNGI